MSKKLIFGSFLIFLLVFSLYLFSMQPSLSLGDGGELTCASYFLGCAHPPGFPLFVSASHPISLLPFGEVAFRGNIFSALFGALAAALVFIWLVEIHGVILAALGAIVVSVLPIFWEESTRIRTYPLLACFVLFILLLWRESLKTKKWEIFVVSFFIWGLGLGAHQLLVSVLPAAALVFLAFKEKWRKLWQIVLAFVLGLLIFPHLLLRADSAFCWGAPKRFEDFLAVIFQKQYQAKIASFDISTWLLMLKSEFSSFADQYYGFWLFAPLGFLTAFKRESLFALACVLTCISMIFVRSGYIGAGEFEQVTRYLLGCYVIYGIFCVEGLAWLLSKLKSLRQAITAITSFALAVAFIYRGALVNWQLQNRVAQQWSWAILYSRPFGSALVVGGDNDIFPIWYQQRVASYRSDIVVMGKYGFWSKWLVGEMREQMHIEYADYKKMIEMGKEIVDENNIGRIRFFGFLKFVPTIRPTFAVFNYTEPKDESSWTLLKMQWAFVPRHYGFELLSKEADFSRSFTKLPPDPLWPLLSLRAKFKRTAHEQEVSEIAQKLLIELGRTYFGGKDISEAIFKAACEIHSGAPELIDFCRELLK